MLITLSLQHLQAIQGAADKFTDETGIKTYKWNVASYEESKGGLAKVEADLGPH